MSPAVVAAGGRAKAILGHPITSRIIQLVAVLSLVVALYVGTQQISLNNCVIRYMDDNNASTKARASAADKDRIALDKMVTTIVGATSNQTVRQALNDYVKARSDANKERELNPLPGPPSSVC